MSEGAPQQKGAWIGVVFVVLLVFGIGNSWRNWFARRASSSRQPTPTAPAPLPPVAAPAAPPGPDPSAICADLLARHEIPNLTERVFVEAVVIDSEGGYPRVVGATNLLSGMELTVHLANASKQYPSEATVDAGCFATPPMGGHFGIPAGRYDLMVGTVYATYYSPNVREVIGERGERLRGSAVHREGPERVVEWSKSVQLAGPATVASASAAPTGLPCGPNPSSLTGGAPRAVESWLRSNGVDPSSGSLRCGRATLGASCWELTCELPATGAWYSFKIASGSVTSATRTR